MYTGINPQTDLEEIVDKLGMSAVVSLLSQIAGEKAEHIRTNWQDEGLAKQWERLSRVLDKSYVRVEKVGRGL